MKKNKEIIFVTSNDNKVQEASQILGVPLKRVNLELDEIQSMDLAEIIEHKARQAYARLKMPVLVEDVGFYIKQWNGFPGPLIKFAAHHIGYDVLAKILIKEDRTVEWQVMYGFFDGKIVKTFKGSIFGTIAPRPRGTKGWGFDVVFIPDGQTKTYAEMGSAEKMKISARALALKKVARHLHSLSFPRKRESSKSAKISI